MKLRLANTTDAKELLDIYSQYIETKTTFEETLPTEEEFAKRIANVLEEYPYLVCEVDGRIVGYAYAHKFRERAAYQWSCETSIYIDQTEQSKGYGRRLYSALFDLLREQGVQMLYAGVTIPNEKSEGLHTSMGFRDVGVFENAGYKCGNWHSVKWFEKQIGSLPNRPVQIIPCFRDFFLVQ